MAEAQATIKPSSNQGVGHVTNFDGDSIIEVIDSIS
jgi:hypothetical protein